MVEGRGAGHNFLYVSIFVALDWVGLMCFIWAVLGIVVDRWWLISSQEDLLKVMRVKLIKKEMTDVSLNGKDPMVVGLMELETLSLPRAVLEVAYRRHKKAMRGLAVFWKLGVKARGFSLFRLPSCLKPAEVLGLRDLGVLIRVEGKGLALNPLLWEEVEASSISGVRIIAPEVSSSQVDDDFGWQDGVVPLLLVPERTVRKLLDRRAVQEHLASGD